MVNANTGNDCNDIFLFLSYFFLKKKYKKIERVHLNEFELIIIAPIFKLLFKSKISSHLRCPLEIKKKRKTEI